ncbi:hypothetical protein ABK040_000389 [Willaertia magna]
MTKRKLLAVTGYCGFHLKGSQIQSKVPYNHTIEGILVNKLFKEKLIKEINYNDPKKLHLQRSSRTDKGVHALSNLFSIKIESNIDKGNEQEVNYFLENLRQALNEDEDGILIEKKYGEKVIANPKFKVFHLALTSKRHDIRSSCLWRGYEYVIPVDILINLFLRNNQFKERLKRLCEEANLSEDSLNLLSIPNHTIFPIIEERELMKLTNIITLKLNHTLSQMEGHHSFANFTNIEKENCLEKDIEINEEEEEENEESTIVKNTTKQQQTIDKKRFLKYQRTIFHCYAKPFVIHNNLSNTLSIRVKLAGNGFLYNQIRKMVSLAVLHLIIPECFDQEYIEFALKSNQDLFVPTAPGESLILTRASLEDSELDNEIMYYCRDQQIEYKNNVLYPMILNTYRSVLDESWERYFKFVENNVSILRDQKEKIRKEAIAFIEKTREEVKDIREKELTKKRNILNDGELLPERALPKGYKLHFYSKFRLFPNSGPCAKLFTTLEEWIINKKIDLTNDYSYYDRIVFEEGLLRPSESRVDDEL